MMRWGTMDNGNFQKQTVRMVVQLLAEDPLAVQSLPCVALCGYCPRSDHRPWRAHLPDSCRHLFANSGAALSVLLRLNPDCSTANQMRKRILDCLVQEENFADLAARADCPNRLLHQRLARETNSYWSIVNPSKFASE